MKKKPTEWQKKKYRICKELKKTNKLLKQVIKLISMLEVRPIFSIKEVKMANISKSVHDL